MDLIIASLAERPDLADKVRDFDGLWPVFMQQDPIADLFYSRFTTTYAAFTLLAFAADDLDHPVARSCSIPFAMGSGVGRSELPDDGWDGVIRWAWLDAQAGRRATHLSALEVVIRPDLRSTGLASVMLEAKRQNAIRLGFSDLYAPVRPTLKTRSTSSPVSGCTTGSADGGRAVRWSHVTAPADQGPVHWWCAPWSSRMPGCNAWSRRCRRTTS